jgi:hypothetical protein
MATRGQVGNEMRATRFVSGGKIANLATAFRVTGDSPFSITVIPKANVSSGIISAPTDLGIIVSCILYEGDAAVAHPFYFNEPSIALIYELPANSIDTSIYDVYWHSGMYGIAKQ